MDLVKMLERQTPKGRYATPLYRPFVRAHFEQLVKVRCKGYSWEQIADAVQANRLIPAKNLTKSLATAFYHIKYVRGKTLKTKNII